MRYFDRTPIRYRIILISALVMASLFLLQAYMHHYVYAELKAMGEFNWWREAPVPYLNFLFWALLAPLVYSILIRWPLNERPLWRTIAVHLGLSLAIASVHEATTSAIYYAILYRIGDFKLEAEYINWAVHALPPAILSRFMEYWTLMIVLIALDNARMMREKQTQLMALRNDLQRSQLNALKKQLQPHFLFNTLNTVSALMDENVNDARRVLARLGQLLRITLDKEQRDRVPLQREIDLIGNYLGIEAVRFHDRLQVTYAIPEDCSQAMVPSMMLQPLVENAIKHGPGSTSSAVDIAVEAHRNNGHLHLRVRDNGRGCADIQKAVNGTGIGLRNVRERLRLIYGPDAAMEVASPGGQGFIVDLTLPYRSKDNGHETDPHDHRR
ncbi:MAG: histidine kinase [Flavobacteriales bacterium]|nr:histidine kinase [Flavobacteriales bacterium]MCB9192896.1 histidine kinase [Flavobacteriales bacterium]